MTQPYYGTKRIMAWPEEKDGRQGYGVKYADGYLSWSPEDAFMEAYQPITAMNFGHALAALKAGGKVARQGWNGKGIFIELQVPDVNSKMTSPYIYINTTGLQTDNEKAPKSLVPWLASQTDMLANDWCIVDPSPWELN